MAETDISSAISSDLTNSMTDYSVDSTSLEGVQDQKETTWEMTEWEENLGYYKDIPELKTAIDTKATWTAGAGFEANPVTTLLLGTIKGMGKDSFNSILKNQHRVCTIGGDSFAEIIRDDQGTLINIKPLDPSTIRIVINRQGLLKRYEQTSKIKKSVKKFKVEQIFHLSRDRIGDEIHGISVIPAVKWIIKARNEAMADWKKMMHRNVQPLWFFHLDTDDTAEIAAFKAKQDTARANGENMYIPKGVVVPELVATATNASLNPLNWIAQLNDYFFQVVNTPQIIIGNAKEFTDASGKIVYLSYEQSVKSEQLYMQEQILGQLNLEVNLIFPASLQNELISDEAKQPEMAAAAPNDTTEELEGAT